MTRRYGFALIEALLALIVFGVAITAAVKVLHHMSELNQSIVHSGAMSKRAQNIMVEIMHEAMPGDEFARDVILDLDEETEARIVITSIDTLNDDEVILDAMYLIELSVYSKFDESIQPKNFRVVHYLNAFGNPSL